MLLGHNPGDPHSSFIGFTLARSCHIMFARSFFLAFQSSSDQVWPIYKQCHVLLSFELTFDVINHLKFAFVSYFGAILIVLSFVPE